jgi:TniQ
MPDLSWTNLRPLPRTVAPFRGETTASYFSRLAAANHSDEKSLLAYITGIPRVTFPFAADRLAVVAGRDEWALRLAIPDLSLGRNRGPGNPRTYSRRKDDGLACRLCAAAKGIAEPVRCWKQPEEVICLRHGRWIGNGSTADSDQPDLRCQPDILQAHRRHLRLVRRHGRDAVAVGYAFAEHICRRWIGERSYNEGFRQRMEIFDGADWSVHHTAPVLAAAIYPQVVALTRLLASPFWQTQGQPDNPAGQQRFAGEVSRTIAPGYRWPQPPRSGDPLCQWIMDRRPHDPPLLSYRRWPSASWLAAQQSERDGALSECHIDVALARTDRVAVVGCKPGFST